MSEWKVDDDYYIRHCDRDIEFEMEFKFVFLLFPFIANFVRLYNVYSVCVRREYYSILKSISSLH